MALADLTVQKTDRKKTINDTRIEADKEIIHLVLWQEGVAILGDSADGHINRVRISGVHLLGNEPNTTAV